MTETFRVISVQNIKEMGSWSINDAHSTGLTIMPQSRSVRDVMQALKEIGYLKQGLQFRCYDFDEDCPHRTLTLVRKRDRYFVVQLELLDEPVPEERPHPYYSN